MHSKTVAASVGIFALFAVLTLLAMPILLSVLARTWQAGAGISVGRYVRLVTLPTGVTAMLIYLLIAWFRERR